MIGSTRFLRVSLLEGNSLKPLSLQNFSLSKNESYKPPEFPSHYEILSDKNKERCLTKLQSLRISPRRSSEENRKKAAVLIPLCLVDDQVSLLYTLRRANLKRHRGQVSFPGGIMDESDKDLEETALRETEEELGIPRSRVQVWGSGSIVVGAEFSVLPVLGYIGHVKIPDLKPNPDEVEVPFTLPVKHFCDSNNCGYTQFRVGGKEGYVLPVYTNGPYRVWGITALITHVILMSLLPSHYKHTLQFVRSPLPNS